jgi:hypothetical protein
MVECDLQLAEHSFYSLKLLQWNTLIVSVLFAVFASRSCVEENSEDLNLMLCEAIRIMVYILITENLKL